MQYPALCVRCKTRARSADLGDRWVGVSGRRNVDYDVKVYSVANQHGVRIIPLTFDTTKNNIFEVLQGRIETWTQVVADKAVTNAPHSNIEFKPLVFSTGGMMSKDTIKELDLWEKDTSPGAIALMRSSISICLLKSRAKLLGVCLIMPE